MNELNLTALQNAATGSDQHEFNELWLLHLSDSALPIGSTSHSFGLETMVESGLLDVGRLQLFLTDYLQESGAMEGTFCAAAHRLVSPRKATFEDEWNSLNNRLGAYRPARESRTASATLGRRFLSLVADMTGFTEIRDVVTRAVSIGMDIHHSAAFGLVGGILGIDEKITVRAFLHQSLTSMISSCQRLLPLGQVLASRILWNLKPEICRVSILCVSEASLTGDPVSFTPSIEMGAMRHPALRTRLFIS
ncbi:MAG: urease accessory protein [Blastocatellia bacterium]|jgi:urease accessory protein|nr:urease accessory protein [Blastocatellia bacterium]